MGRLEHRLSANPNDLSSRTQIIGYYFFHKEARQTSDQETLRRHIRWIIQYASHSTLAGRPYIGVHPQTDPEFYTETKTLWLTQVGAHKDNAQVLGNAAVFFLLHDCALAEDLLKKAKRLEPANPAWSEKLGRLYSLGLDKKDRGSKAQMAVQAFKQLRASFSSTKDSRGKFYKLASLAKAALEAGQLEKARTYASELLDIAGRYKKDWNYGNAIHHGNLVLGRLALHKGNMEDAKDHLLKAGNTSGSPQLDSFGPNMTLAKELLESGERDAVLKYFELCGSFWKMGRDRLEEWKSTVKAGRIPDFRGNLRY